MSWLDVEHPPSTRHQAGNRHLNLHAPRDNLCGENWLNLSLFTPHTRDVDGPVIVQVAVLEMWIIPLH